MNYYRQLLSETECENLISKISNRTPDDTNAKEKLPDYFFIDEPVLAAKLWRRIETDNMCRKPHDSVIPEIRHYNGRDYILKGLNNKMTLLHYHKGYKMGYHEDPPFQSQKDTELYYGSLVVFLSTLDENKGGVLEFKEPPVSFCSIRGDGVIISPKFIHKVTETSSDRYSLVVNILYKEI